MECCICYEKFISKTELSNYYNNNKNNLDVDLFFKFKNLLMSEKTYKCPTINCDVFICDNCLFKLIENEELYKCPYCRNIDWKIHMDYVLSDLIITKFGIITFVEEICKNIPMCNTE